MSKYINGVQLKGAIVASFFLAAIAVCNSSQSATDTAPAITIGNQIDDSVFVTKVRSALLGDDVIHSLDVKVSVDKGVVLLSGFVDNQAQIDRATAVATDIEGVKSIENKLIMKVGKQTLGNKVDDSVITAGVKHALLYDPKMNSLDVSVTTRKGEVQLSGFVDNASQLARAAVVAASVDGVTGVINHLMVKQ